MQQPPWLRFYILDENRQPKAASSIEWAEMFQDIGRRAVAHTRISENIWVATMFHGHDPSMLVLRDKPKLFGTLIHGGRFSGREFLHETWDEAKTNHERAVKIARAAMRKRR